MTQMLLPVLAGLWTASAVLMVAWPRRPAAPRRAEVRGRPSSPDQLLDRLTVRVWQAARRPVPGPAGRRRVRRVAAGVAVAVWIAPPMALVVLGAVWLWSRYEALRALRRSERAVIEALPDAVDLLLLATSAGRSLPMAHPLVAARLPAPLGPALALAATEADRGRARADALVDALAPLGTRATALGYALGDHLRYGMPLVPTLEHMGMELRIERRRLAEERARRVPVRLLGPLVTCVLPALGLLTVIPLVAASLQALPT